MPKLFVEKSLLVISYLLNALMWKTDGFPKQTICYHHLEGHREPAGVLYFEQIDGQRRASVKWRKDDDTIVVKYGQVSDFDENTHFPLDTASESVFSLSVNGAPTDPRPVVKEAAAYLEKWLCDTSVVK